MARASAMRWLWFTPVTLGPALEHSNAALRVFALIGPAAAHAAAALLSMLPSESRHLLQQPLEVCLSHLGPIA